MLEIEEQLIKKDIDLAVHSMKDLPSQESKNNLKIVCWLQRHGNEDVLISNLGKSFYDLPSGSIIGTSSIRRRSQILNLRKDLSIKLLRGNVDTRINKLQNKEYDAIILSKAGLDRLNLSHLITEVLDKSIFLPAANQGAVGIQSNQDSSFNDHLRHINHSNTETECLAERMILRLVNANCNSPISVSASVASDQIKISCDLFDHDGEKLFHKTIKSKQNEYAELSKAIADEIISTVGQTKINTLDKLENDLITRPHKKSQSLAKKIKSRDYHIDALLSFLIRNKKTELNQYTDYIVGSSQSVLSLQNKSLSEIKETKESNFLC